jgi:hypothetical protein
LIFPAIGRFQKTAVAFLPDKPGGFSVFFVFVALFTVKAVNGHASGIIVTICAGVKPFAHAADFHPASGLFNISLAVFVADLTSPAPGFSVLRASFTVGAAASYL